MEYLVYALKSLRKNYIYVGLTSDVERRLREHNDGKEKTTRPYVPFELLMVKPCDSRMQARRIEKYLKSGIGKEKLKSLI